MVLRLLLRDWLRKCLGDKIRKKAVAARETAGEMQGDGPLRNGPQTTAGRQTSGTRTTPHDCLSADVGVVFALPIEAGGTIDLLDSHSTTQGHGFVTRRGSRHGRRLMLVESGAGSQRAAAATEALIEACRPGCVISAGFAGGLTPALKRHDIVVADSLTNAAGRTIDVDLQLDLGGLLERAHVGRIVSVEKIARRPSEKEALGRSHHALAVDLESFAVADVCRRRGVRFMGVRVITDATGEQLPPDVQYLSQQTTAAARLGAALGVVCRRPASLKEMWRLKQTALVASDRLAGLLDRLIRELP